MIKSHHTEIPNDLADNGLEKLDSTRCTNGGTDTPESVQTIDLDALADALRNLTPDDKAALARLLAAGE